MRTKLNQRTSGIRNTGEIVALFTAAALITATVFISSAAAGPAPVQFQKPDVYEKNLERTPVGRRGTQPKVNLWTRQGEGAALRPGQTVDIFFRTNRDAFVVVYNIDTRGRANLLFPRRGDDGFVRRGRTMRLPEKRSGYELTVTGPAGVERIVALASKRPIRHQWREFADEDIYLSSFGPDCGYDITERGFTRGLYGDDNVSWNASATVGTQNASIGVNVGNQVQPQLRRTPVDRVVPRPTFRHGVTRAETWFEVVTSRRWNRRGRGY